MSGAIQSTTSLVFLLTATSLVAESARDIVSRSLEAERENKRRMVNYLFIEEISRKSFDREGNEVAEYKTSYEVTFIEGRPAFRRTSLNGRPLTEEEDRAELARLRQLAEDRRKNPDTYSSAEDRRRSHPYAQFFALHEFRLAGDDIMDGRPCWKIESTPRSRLKTRDQDQQRIAKASATFWIDKETGHRVRMDVRALEPLNRDGVYESTSYHWAQRDGSVWLITSIQTVLPLRGNNSDVAWYQGQQTYSKYRRFTIESNVSAVEEIAEPR